MGTSVICWACRGLGSINFFWAFLFFYFFYFFYMLESRANSFFIINFFFLI